MFREGTLNKRILEDCSGEESFWVNYGPIINNLTSLVEAIEKMRLYTFRYHVNQDNNKNDFADWIRTSLEDKDLAMRLEGVTDKDKYLEILKHRKDELKLLKS
jgi:hypothetical protein